MRLLSPKISRKRRLGASSIEYMTVLACVVIPLVIFVVPLGMHMISLYYYRIMWSVWLPVG